MFLSPPFTTFDNPTNLPPTLDAPAEAEEEDDDVEEEEEVVVVEEEVEGEGMC